VRGVKVGRGFLTAEYAKYSNAETLELHGFSRMGFEQKMIDSALPLPSFHAAERAGKTGDSPAPGTREGKLGGGSRIQFLLELAADEFRSFQRTHPNAADGVHRDDRRERALLGRCPGAGRDGKLIRKERIRKMSASDSGAGVSPATSGVPPA
jgi:hypothetical protein